MKIRMTVTLDERCRRAIARHYGMPGLAARERCITALNGLINAWLDDLTYEMDQAEALEPSASHGDADAVERS